MGPTRHNRLRTRSNFFIMATTGELRAIIQELQLVDIGDAASYLGEEATVVEESSVSAQAPSVTDTQSLTPCDTAA
jgi:hypothetical protein